MESSKPIEPGCLALILPYKNGDTRYIGDICTVIEWIEPYKQWSLDVARRPGDEGFRNMLIGAYALMRIDDPDIQKQIESERELENA